MPTKVVGVRADCDFWEKCDEVATMQNTTRNDLIVRAVGDYCQTVIETQTQKIFSLGEDGNWHELQIDYINKE